MGVFDLKGEVFHCLLHVGFTSSLRSLISPFFPGQEIMLERVKLLRTRNTASRQFTIPREVREKYGIKPLDEIEVIGINPVSP
ncbi:hypothetical protein JCM14467A_19780 [Vulcanisaeta sp. JCM 14467]